MSIEPTQTPDGLLLTRPILRWSLFLGGHLFFFLGAAGLFLPLFPTTIFWILAAVCFARSSTAMRDRIYASPGVGPMVSDFVEHGILSRKGKVIATLAIAASVALSAATGAPTFVKIGAILVFAGTSAYLWTRREA